MQKLNFSNLCRLRHGPSVIYHCACFINGRDNTATGRIGESGLSEVPITNTDHWCEGDSAYTSACRGPFFTYYVTYVPALYMGKNSK